MASCAGYLRFLSVVQSVSGLSCHFLPQNDLREVEAYLKQAL